MKKRISTIILILVFIAGLSLLLYPAVSNRWNEMHQSKAIDSYVQSVQDLDEETYNQILEQAHNYNRKLYEEDRGLILSEEQLLAYESQLNLEGTGVMAYLSIEKIGCELPIYHGTEESVLQVAIGHIEGTSLPVGGENTHCVLSGHRGLPSAELFSKLDELEKGDTFVIRTLNETLTYEVDLISIVLPDETDLVKIEEGKDLCTLVTCTPYGVNTHRLLVRGHRVANDDSSPIRVTSEARQYDIMVIAPVFAVPFLVLLLIWMLLHTGRIKRGGKKGGKK